MEPCKCEHQHLVKRLCSNGVTQYKMQCTTCGKCGSAIARASLTPGQLAVAESYDDQLSQRYWDKQQEHRQREIESKSREWWSAYNTYMRSQRWADKRRRVLERDNGICQACLKRPATQVHHKTYENCQNERGEFGYEPLFDLESVCDLCHEWFHEIRRKKREYASSN
jgi:5-methylcytosine-specific restriction endonuclease McrA